MLAHAPWTAPTSSGISSDATAIPRARLVIISVRRATHPCTCSNAIISPVSSRPQPHVARRGEAIEAAKRSSRFVRCMTAGTMALMRCPAAAYKRPLASSRRSQHAALSHSRGVVTGVLTTPSLKLRRHIFDAHTCCHRPAMSVTVPTAGRAIPDSSFVTQA